MLRIAEELITALEQTPEVMKMVGTIAAARAHQANVQGEALIAANFARQALQCLPDIDLVSRSLRAVATSLLGDASSMSGNLEEARQVYQESARICQAAGDIHLTIVINSNLANILVEQGSLQQAAKIPETYRWRLTGSKGSIAGQFC
jgi:ATP/maltotriose-dependent transcriptional regulator MalT